MHKVLPRIALLFWFALVIMGCGPDAIEVLVRVKGLTPTVTALKVSALLNGKAALTDAEFTDQLGQFGIRLPLDASSQGNLKINVFGLADDRCKLSSGTLDTTLSLAVPYSEIELSLVQQDKMCTLTVEKIGDGTVSSMPAGITCGTDCQLDFPYGTQVTLSASRSDSQWFVTDWGSDCGGQQYAMPGTGTCKISLTQSTQIRAKLTNGYCADSGWCWDYQTPQGNNLQAVWGTGSNVWTVGFGGTILKWDGVAWTLHTSGTTSTLRSVWGSDANNVWAVGTGGTILKWNGTAWTPQSSGTTQDLAGVWGVSVNNVWAVGAGGTILRWNGTVWTAQASGTSNYLASVWGTNLSNLWAVGVGGTILMGDYDAPIRTYTDPRMEMSCKPLTSPT